MENQANTSQSPISFVPGVSSSYRHGWKQIWKYFLELFLILIVTLIINSLGSMGSWSKDTNFLDFLGFIYGMLIGSPIGYGTSYAYLKAARGEKVEVKDMFEVFKNYWNAVLASILISVIVIVGFCLLIVPGFIFASKLAFTPYLIVDRKMEVIAAVKESWRMTNGHAMQVFLVILLGILILIAGAIAFGVGIIISMMWISLAMATLYHAVSLSEKQPAQTAA